MPEKKERKVMWLTPETALRLDAGVALAGCRSRSEFTEQAINFYAGHLSAKTHTDYFSEAVSAIVEATILSTENRLARLLFKSAVEQAKQTHVLAAISEVDEDTLQRLHVKCVEEVKRINGTLRFEDAVKRQPSP